MQKNGKADVGVYLLSFERLVFWNNDPKSALRASRKGEVVDRGEA